MKTLKKTTAVITAAVMTVLMFALCFTSGVSADIWDGSTIAGEYAGGSGSEDDPYIISTAAQLARLQDTTDDYGKCFKLTNDIDLDGNQWFPIGGDSGDPAFTGVFDGNGFTVRGLYSVRDLFDASASTYAGVFGKTESAVIKNLTVYGTKLLAKYSGGICGLISKATQIINCHTYIDWMDGSAIGGICGRAQSSKDGINNTILYCTSHSTITQTVDVTGSKDAKKGDIYIGGIVGAAGGADVRYCGNYGNITISRPDSQQVPGLVCVGGIMGIQGASSEAASIFYSYNLGNVTGYRNITTNAASYAGGIVGRAGHVGGAQIFSSYTTGQVVWKTDNGGTEDCVEYYGGIAGNVKNTTTMTNCYTVMEKQFGTNSVDAMDVSTVKTLTLADMTGSAAMKNMDLGSSLNEVLGTAVQIALDGSEYWDYELEAFTKYTDGKTLIDYMKEYVLSKFDLPANADLWITEDGSTPLLGNFDAIMLSAEIPAKAGDMVVEELGVLSEKYKADTVTTEEPDTEPNPTDTDESTPVVTDEPKPTETEAPKPTVTDAPTKTDAPKTDAPKTDAPKTEEPKKGCGGASVFAIVAALVMGISAPIIIKKK